MSAAVPRVGVGAVVWKDGLVLLVRRAREPRLGQWSVPGGRQEYGETVIAAVRREVREEAGIEIGNLALIDVVDAFGPLTAQGRPAYHFTLVDYAADWLSGEVRAGSDAGAARWFDPDEAIARVGWAETVRVIELSRARRLP